LKHHDFPSVPWNKLPKIRKFEGQYYNTLGYHTSYTVLLFQFLFNKEISVYSRMARDNRGMKKVEKANAANTVVESED
jgi:sphingolipid delta-4 desaturase